MWVFKYYGLLLWSKVYLVCGQSRDGGGGFGRHAGWRPRRRPGRCTSLRGGRSLQARCGGYGGLQWGQLSPYGVLPPLPSVLYSSSRKATTPPSSFARLIQVRTSCTYLVHQLPCFVPLYLSLQNFCGRFSCGTNHRAEQRYPNKLKRKIERKWPNRLFSLNAIISREMVYTQQLLY